MPSNVIKYLQNEYNISSKKAEDAWERAKDIFIEDYGKKESDFDDKSYAIITTIAKKIAGSKKEKIDSFINSDIETKQFIETMVSGDFPELKDFSDIIQEPEMDWEDEEDEEKTYYSDMPIIIDQGGGKYFESKIKFNYNVGDVLKVKGIREPYTIEIKKITPEYVVYYTLTGKYNNQEHTVTKKDFVSLPFLRESKTVKEEKSDEELMKSAEKMAKNALGDNASKEELEKLTKKFFDQMSKKDKMNEASRVMVKPPYSLTADIDLLSYGFNPNGNHTVTVDTPKGKKTIQTNSQELYNTHKYLRGRFKDIDPQDLEKISEEIQDYIDKYY